MTDGYIMARKKIRIQKPDLSKISLAKIKPGQNPDDDLPSIPNPLEGLPVLPGAQENADQEISAVRKALKLADRTAHDRFVLAMDSEYWFSVIFQSREQKETFLNLLGWMIVGDKYLDGLELARRMGLRLPQTPLPKDVWFKQVDHTMRNMTDDFWDNWDDEVGDDFLDSEDERWKEKDTERLKQRLKELKKRQETGEEPEEEYSEYDGDYDPEILAEIDEWDGEDWDGEDWDGEEEE